MVVPLKLNQFYGNKLPRPRVYSEVQFSQKRVDPPFSVNEAFLNWAKGAHWSMGGLAFNRMRKQGSIEGDISRLRAENEEARRGRNSVGSEERLLGGFVEDVKDKKTQEYSESSLRRRKGVSVIAPETRGKKTADISTGLIRSRTQIAVAAAAAVSPVLQQLSGVAFRGMDEKVTKKDTGSQKWRSRKGTVRQESSDSDDNLEAFLKEKHRPLRRSRRMQCMPKLNVSAPISYGCAADSGC